MRYLILFSLLFVACASPQPQNCQEADWYEIGRRQGAEGQALPEDLDTGLNICRDSNTAVNVNLYMNGRNAGLVEYCKATNAFELGKEGRDYNEVCPQELHKIFIVNYEKGTKVRQLQERNEDLDRKISSIFNNSKAGDNSSSARQQLNELQKRKADNLSKMNNLERSSN